MTSNPVGIDSEHLSVDGLIKLLPHRIKYWLLLY